MTVADYAMTMVAPSACHAMTLVDHAIFINGWCQVYAVCQQLHAQQSYVSVEDLVRTNPHMLVKVANWVLRVDGLDVGRRSISSLYRA